MIFRTVDRILSDFERKVVKLDKFIEAQRPVLARKAQKILTTQQQIDATNLEMQRAARVRDKIKELVD